VRYAPGVTIVGDDDTEPNLSGYDNFLILPAMSRLQGTITTDDTTNLETDLDMAMDVMKNPPGMNASVDTTTLLNHIFDIQNRSNDGDPLTTPYIPQVIAGFTGFDLGIRTYEPANVSVEVIIDATDLNGNRFVGEGGSNTPMGRPGTTLSPPGALQGD
jgi:hypothetical protein